MNFDEMKTEELNDYIFSEIKISSYEKTIIKSFEDFYLNKNNVNIFTEILSSDISIRLIDYFIIKYSKNNKIILNVKSKNKVNMFVIYVSYKNQLRKWNKKYFDPFSRGTRIPYFITQDKCIITTIGQLNFFKWFIENNIHEYVYQNNNIIEKDMNEANKKNKEINKKKSKTRPKQIVLDKPKPVEKYSKIRVSFF